MTRCPRCRGSGRAVPRMSEGTRAAFVAVGGCLDRVPCDCVAVGMVSLADEHAGTLAVVDGGHLSMARGAADGPR